MNDSKMTDWMTCILTSLGITQYQNQILFWTSLISTVLGLIIAITKQIIVPIAKKIKAKKLTVDDVIKGAEDLKEIGDQIAEDLADDGHLNGSTN